MARVLGILVVVAVIATAAFGSAAGLDVSAGAVQVGADGLTCDGDGVYVAEWNMNESGWITSVRIAGIDSCSTSSVKVCAQLYAGNDLKGGGCATGTVPEVTVTFASPVDAPAVTDLKVTLLAPGTP